MNKQIIFFSETNNKAQKETKVGMEAVDDRTRNRVSWKDLCLDFTQNTTLHGIQYTTLKSTYALRR